MSKPMTANQLITQLRKWRIAFEPYRSDWATHNRGDRGNGFSDIHGIIQHHTGTDGDARGTCYSGRTGLPGPLCHVVNDTNGKLWLVGWGRANHAGLGDSDVLAKVTSENYSGVLVPHHMNTDGNGHFYGIENEYSGSHGMTKAQYWTACKFSAAVSDFHHWTDKSTIGHGEWSTEKWDPGYAPGKMMDMNAMRNDIADILKSGPGTTPVADTRPPKTGDAAKVYTLKTGDSVVIGNSTLKVTEVK